MNTSQRGVAAAITLKESCDAASGRSCRPPASVGDRGLTFDERSTLTPWSDPDPRTASQPQALREERKCRCLLSPARDLLDSSSRDEEEESSDENEAGCGERSETFGGWISVLFSLIPSVSGFLCFSL